ncbi:hypothetical protein [Nocardia vaccinii]|uniref:hypothetical protein n=1 Tax=Nocardia vaccinii TaxID=1822 RepID=UPI0008313B52|nr:hypothetical protein [Nocardia vaccinii]
MGRAPGGGGGQALAPDVVRTMRAWGLIGKPIRARSLAGSFRLGSTIAALRWLLGCGYVASGTSPAGGSRRELVYWLTDNGVGVYRNLCAVAGVSRYERS